MDIEIFQEVVERRRLKQIEAAVVEIEELIDRIGPDNHTDESVIKFTKYFRGNDTPYTYAALKKNGAWYTTGPRGNVYTWDELVLWMIDSHKPATYYDKLL